MALQSHKRKSYGKVIIKNEVRRSMLIIDIFYWLFCFLLTCCFLLNGFKLEWIWIIVNLPIVHNVVKLKDVKIETLVENEDVGLHYSHVPCKKSIMIFIHKSKASNEVLVNVEYILSFLKLKLKMSTTKLSHYA